MANLPVKNRVKTTTPNVAVKSIEGSASIFIVSSEELIEVILPAIFKKAF